MSFPTTGADEYASAGVMAYDPASVEPPLKFFGPVHKHVFKTHYL